MKEVISVHLHFNLGLLSIRPLCLDMNTPLFFEVVEKWEDFLIAPWSYRDLNLAICRIDCSHRGHPVIGLYDPL